MSDERRKRRILRRRGQVYAEQLMENSSLRDNLEDEQATQLLDWGLQQVKDSVKKTANLPEEDAQPTIEKETTAVRLIMQGVNDLVGSVGKPLEFDIIDDTMTRVLKNLRWLTEAPPKPQQLNAVAQFQQARQDDDKARAFQALMQLVDPQAEENSSSLEPKETE